MSQSDVFQLHVDVMVLPADRVSLVDPGQRQFLVIRQAGHRIRYIQVPVLPRIIDVLSHALTLS